MCNLNDCGNGLAASDRAAKRVLRLSRKVLQDQKLCAVATVALLTLPLPTSPAGGCLDAAGGSAYMQLDSRPCLARHFVGLVAFVLNTTIAMQVGSSTPVATLALGL